MKGDIEMVHQDTIIRAYARLKGLRSNVDKLGWVEDTYANEYHSILDTLDKTGINTTEFRVPASEIQRRVVLSSPSGNTYSDEKYVPKVLLLAKLDAILAYFEIITSDKPKRVGFTPPNKS
jgi:hypothetical protein